MKEKHNPHKCQIWVCSHQSIRPMVVKAIIDIIRRDPVGIDFQCIWNDALIARSRNRAATIFLESNAEVMFFVDDDIYFTTDAFYHVLTNCLKGYDMIAGFYSTKPVVQCAHKMLPGTRAIVPSNQPPIEAKYISTGMMAIHRRVLEAMATKYPMCYVDPSRPEYKMIKPFYNFFEPFYYDKEFLSEDWSFVQRAKDLGFKCWLDPFAYCIHFGWYAYGLIEGMRPPAPKDTAVELICDPVDTAMTPPTTESNNFTDKIIKTVMSKYGGMD